MTLSETGTRALMERLFFAYREFTRDADRVLAEQGLGRAHHRALYFIGRSGEISVRELLDILGVTKQSLTGVLGKLLASGLVEQRRDPVDRRRRLLRLTEHGQVLEVALVRSQRSRLEDALAAGGPGAFSVMEDVLEAMMEPRDQRRLTGDSG